MTYHWLATICDFTEADRICIGDTGAFCSDMNLFPLKQREAVNPCVKDLNPFVNSISMSSSGHVVILAGFTKLLVANLKWLLRMDCSDVCVQELLLC